MKHPQGYSVFDSDLGFRLHKLTFLGNIASMKKSAEAPKQYAEIRRNTQAKTPSKNTRSYSGIIFTDIK